MPIHSYKCDKCGKVASELFHPTEKFPVSIKCKCGGKAKKQVSTCSFKMGNKAQRGFMSNGKTIKNDPDARKNVRSHYFGDGTDEATFVK